MSYTKLQLRLLWQDIFPYTCIIAGWGIVNIWLYYQADKTSVLPAGLRAVWLCNCLLFILIGCASFLYIAFCVRRQAILFEKTLEAFPFPVIISSMEHDSEYTNSKANELMHSGLLNGINDPSNWTCTPVEFFGIRFPGVYSFEGAHISLENVELKDSTGKEYGNVVMLFNVSEWWDSRHSSQKYAYTLHDLNEYLEQAAKAFSESIDALSSSTVNQAKAFHDLAKYLLDVASDIDSDADSIRSNLSQVSGSIQNCDDERRRMFEKLNESAELMKKSHFAVQKAAGLLSEMNRSGTM